MRLHSFSTLFRACRHVMAPAAITAVVLVLWAWSPPMVSLRWETPLQADRPEKVVTAAAVATAEPAPAQAATPLTTCTPSPDVPVPTIVAAIFRCRLTEAGFAPEQVRQITAEALVVAECESHFDPNAVVFDGAYLNTPHPGTGSYYTAAGLFQFLRDRADRFVEGGYANVTHPVANADAAARVYVRNAQRGFPGWSDWACAAANDGFRAVSVLPGWPGGPAKLPQWAFEH